MLFDYRDLTPASVRSLVDAALAEAGGRVVVDADHPRDAFLGIARFDDLQERLGISRNILNKRLTHLVDEGVLDEVAYSEHPPRYDYRLTAKGRDLWPIMTAMRQWGDKHAAPDGPPVRVVHTKCDQVTHAVMTRASCGERMTGRDVRAVPGPGDFDHLVRAPVTTSTIP